MNEQHNAIMVDDQLSSAAANFAPAGVDYDWAVEQFYEALQQLEEKYRAPLAMFYLEELSYKEMAEVLGLPIGTIMSRLSRGKEILRKRLQAASPVTINCRHADRTVRWQGGLVASAV